MSNFFGKSAQSECCSTFLTKLLVIELEGYEIETRSVWCLEKADEKPNKSIKEEKDGGSTASPTVSKKSQHSPKSECGVKEEQSNVSKSLKNESKDTRK